MTERQRITPFDTGKIKIGIHYAPPPQRNLVSYDEIRLQNALIDASNDRYFTPPMPLRWAIPLVGIGVLALLAAG